MFGADINLCFSCIVHEFFIASLCGSSNFSAIFTCSGVGKCEEKGSCVWPVVSDPLWSAHILCFSARVHVSALIPIPVSC